MSACSMHAVGGPAISSNRTGATRGTESVRTAQGLLRFGGGFVSGNVSGPEGVREGTRTAPHHRVIVSPSVSRPRPHNTHTRAPAYRALPVQTQTPPQR